MDSSVKDFNSSATHSPPISPPESPSESPGITSSPSASPPRDIPQTEACHSLYQQEEASIGSFVVIPALASSSLFKDKSNTHSHDKNLAGARKTSEDTIDHSKYSFFPSLHQQGGGHAAQCEEESMQHHSQGEKRHHFSGWPSRPSSPALHAKENIKTFTEDSMASKRPEASSNLSVGHDQFRIEVAKLAATQENHHGKIPCRVNISRLQRNEIHYITKKYRAIPGLLDVKIVALPNSDRDGICWHEIRVEASLIGKLLADVKNKMTACEITSSSTLRLRDGWREGESRKKCRVKNGSINFNCKLVQPEQLHNHPSKDLEVVVEFELSYTPVLTRWESCEDMLIVTSYSEEN